MYDLHDWTLKSLIYNWSDKILTIDLTDSSSDNKELLAENVTDLKVPHHDEWGKSLSILEAPDILKIDDKNKKLVITMQSGDMIEIVAGKFEFL
jgi:transcription antitermination factor NusG